MPRYRTISRWWDRSSGKYIDPPTEVILGEESGASLQRAGCVEPLTENPEPSKTGPPESSPPPPQDSEEAPSKPAPRKARRRKAKSKQTGR